MPGRLGRRSSHRAAASWSLARHPCPHAAHAPSVALPLGPNTRATLSPRISRRHRGSSAVAVTRRSNPTLPRGPAAMCVWKAHLSREAPNSFCTPPPNRTHAHRAVVLSPVGRERDRARSEWHLTVVLAVHSTIHIVVPHARGGCLSNALNQLEKRNDLSTAWSVGILHCSSAILAAARPLPPALYLPAP
jgi:hypothetical protein